ncbi:MAG: type I restriction enzyme HsdR N-terminal domain-containing protein, partial [Elusimicrobiota bacterium]|nr:type I restriction enzyme HsdR N-terminal domain-containing protein [Elusimicrobiota bacterium]
MENSIKEKLFNGLNFKTILSNADFTEESVRAVIVDPLLKELGYGQSDIVRNKNLQLKAGSAQKAISLMPDYLLKTGEYFSFVLDAKSPSQNILDEGNINQAFSYAIHPDVKSKYFALCNGLEFALFRTFDEKSAPIFYFKLEDIDENFERLKNYLSPQSFHSGKEAQYIRPQD